MIVVLSLIGLLVGRALVTSMIVRPYRELTEDITKKEDRVARYRADVDLRAPSIGKWRAYGARTLGADAYVAQNFFDKDLKQLIQTHRLSKESVRPLSPRKLKSGLVLVPFNVQAQGNIRNIVAFLTTFYERPYLARITSLNLAPISSKKQDVLVMRVAAETLVLPETEMAGTIKPVDPATKSFEKRKRYFSEEQALAALTDRDPFLPYVPPPKRVVIAPPKKETPKPKEKEKPPPPPPKKKTVDPSVIVALLSYPGHGEVVTMHPGTKVRTIHHLGQEMAGGKLVMVHPLGAVVGIEEEFWLLPNGVKVSDEEQRVLADEVPQVQRKLTPLLEKRDREMAEREAREAERAAKEAQAAAAAKEAEADRAAEEEQADPEPDEPNSDESAKQPDVEQPADEGSDEPADEKKPSDEDAKDTGDSDADAETNAEAEPEADGEEKQNADDQEAKESSDEE